MTWCRRHDVVRGVGTSSWSSATLCSSEAAHRRGHHRTPKNCRERPGRPPVRPELPPWVAWRAGRSGRQLFGVPRTRKKHGPGAACGLGIGEVVKAFPFRELIFTAAPAPGSTRGGRVMSGQKKKTRGKSSGQLSTLNETPRDWTSGRRFTSSRCEAIKTRSQCERSEASAAIFTRWQTGSVGLASRRSRWSRPACTGFPS